MDARGEGLPPVAIRSQRYSFRFQEKADTGACRPAMRRKDQNLALGWSQNSATDGAVIGSPEVS